MPTSLAPELDGVKLSSYDHIIVAFSGGKDSLACILGLLDHPDCIRSRIELMHHDVDGGGPPFMDWPCTPSYCRSVAKHLKLPIYFSRKIGGFKREMLRDGTPTAPTEFQVPGGPESMFDVDEDVAGGNGPPGTRLKFPQKSADLRVRWCSAYLKIDVCALAIRNQDRFWGRRTLVITGERAQESAARAKYAEFEPHRAHGKQRHVDQWRPLLHWDERQVWDIIERWKINPHPAYRLGWGRVSCMTCIFGSPDQWASAAVVAPDQVEGVAGYEERFGVTIDRRRSVAEMIAAGRPYPMDPAIIAEAISTNWVGPARVEQWETPAGAYGDSSGPT